MIFFDVRRNCPRMSTAQITVLLGVSIVTSWSLLPLARPMPYSANLRSTPTCGLLLAPGIVLVAQEGVVAPSTVE